MPKKNQKTSKEVKLKISQTKRMRKASGYYKKIRICDFCGKKLKCNQKRFCSLKCKGLLISGKEHPMYKDGLSKARKECTSCGTSISIRNKMNLCRVCYEKQQHKENHPAWKGGISTANCITCGKIIGGNAIRCRTCFNETKQRSIIQSKKWQDSKYAKIQANLILEGLEGVSPNKPERKLRRILNKLFSKEYKFVGDGKIWIGGKNPDFINVNGQKKLIELFGDYWHSKKITGLKKKVHRKQRQYHFKKYGFKTCVIWEYELKNIPKLKNKLKKFHKALL